MQDTKKVGAGQMTLRSCWCMIRLKQSV